ncbi:response regulator [Candidatus Uabimicrobium sp. HlEnr_7]|uniref:protein kinase domain-containing protein n=1 Tax=Candidatus Uabimicrobium helgolandensis TaxID=3095367 RepID=UPI00355859BB
MSRILIVDDTVKNIQVLGTILKNEGYQINIAQNGIQALKIAQKIDIDLILLDIMMPEIDGFETCKRLKNSLHSKDIPVIFLTAKVDSEDIVKGFKLGAVDYVTKPFNSTELLVRVNLHLTMRYLQKELARRNRTLTQKLRVTQELFKEASSRLDGSLLGESESIRKIRDAIFVHGKKDDHLLLVGLPGSGDEAIARAVHNLSPRAKQPFIYINCIQVQMEDVGVFSLDNPDGSFISKFHLADGGTLYLDGVHELPFAMQSKMLDSLEKLADPSSNLEIRPDVRLITYSPVKLSLHPEKFNFNPRLLNFLEKNVLQIPSLVERSIDIPVLVKYFAKLYAQQLGKSFETISEKTIERLEKYSWPGNIRELQSVLERNVILNEGDIFEIGEEFLQEGKTVDRYHLIEKIGEGAMGEVWRAKHQLLARPAAIKLIRTDVLGDSKKKESALKRFQLEAKATANLLSPNTVKLYDYGITEKGALYYVMQLLRGLDLYSLALRFGPIKPSRLIMLLKQACRSLMEAHDSGLVHRDIKPQNLFVCKLGIEYDFLKILDFGIAKKISNEDYGNVTSSSEFLGTPLYTAPEALSRKEKITDRSDIYSLGCVAYWALTGCNVIKSKKIMQILLDHVKLQPEPPSVVCNFEISPQMDTMIMKCLEKDPQKRFSARELWDFLDKMQLEDAWNERDAEKWWHENLPELTKRSNLFENDL